MYCIPANDPVFGRLAVEQIFHMHITYTIRSFGLNTLLQHYCLLRYDTTTWEGAVNGGWGGAP